MATYTTTAKWALRALTGTSNVSEIDTGFAALAADLDTKLTPYDAGLLSSRPVSTVGTPGKAGREYYATDIGVLFIDLGTSWLPVGQVPLVATLPGSPYDGQEVDYQNAAMATANVVWRFRHKASASAWLPAGGEALYDNQSTEASGASTGSGTWGQVDANDPTVTVPLTGTFMVFTCTQLDVNVSNAFLWMGVKVNSTNPTTSADQAAGHCDGSQRTSMSVKFPKAFTAGDVLLQTYKHTDGLNTSGSRRRGTSILEIRPVSIPA